MIMTAGEMIDWIQGMVEDTSTETRTEILRHLNLVYKRHAHMRNWTMHTKLVTGQGSILPADLVRIVYVEDDTDRLYFNIEGVPQRYFSRYLYNYFIKQETATPLYVAASNNGAITAGETSFTDTTNSPFTSDMAGEYIRIGQNTHPYKISAYVSADEVTLENGYRGSTETAAYYEVRPYGTMQIAFTNEEGSSISSDSIKMWYLADPLPLYNDYDPILLPGTCEALMIAVVRLMDETNRYNNDSLKKIGDYKRALREMKNMDQTPSQFVMPRTNHGTRFKFGRSRVGNVRYDSSGNVYL